MDKTFADLKNNITQLYTETQTKANQAIDSGTNDFKTQCEEMIKKFPMLPEGAYKDTLKALTDSKGKVNGALEKQYKDVLAKLDQNYAKTKKELTMPELKAPKLPALDLSPNLLDKAKNAVATAAPIIQNIAKNVPGPSK